MSFAPRKVWRRERRLCRQRYGRRAFLGASLAGLIDVGARRAAGATPTFPGRTWQAIDPAKAGLSAAGLEALRRALGGRGCVVRGGRMAFTWGDVARPADVASAAKPVYGHFLHRAIERGQLKSLDDRVSQLEPRLDALNAPLGYKDRQIRWRDLINQTSCYGAVERPGEAFDYSDFNMALLFDTLFLKVYGAPLDEVDRAVLHPLLARSLGFEDAATFLAFGPRNRPGRLAISPRDFARFALFYLRRGAWNGAQLLAAETAHMATTTPLPSAFPRTSGRPAAMIAGQRSIGGGNNQTDHFGSYSFAWWTNGIDRDGKRHWPDAPLGTFAALGHGGQHGIAAIPSLDLIVSWNDSPVQTRAAQNLAFKALAQAVVAVAPA